MDVVATETTALVEPVVVTAASLQRWKRRNLRNARRTTTNMKPSRMDETIDINSDSHDNDKVVIAVSAHAPKRLSEDAVVWTKTSCTKRTNIEKKKDESTIPNIEQPPKPVLFLLQDDGVVTNGTNTKPSASFTYPGERRGTTENEELLALLRGISSASSSLHRFDVDNKNNTKCGEPFEMIPPPATVANNNNNSVLPWKKRNRINIVKSKPVVHKIEEKYLVIQEGVSPVLASTAAASIEHVPLPIKNESPRTTQTSSLRTFGGSGGALQSDIVSKSYQGERCGVDKEANTSNLRVNKTLTAAITVIEANSCTPSNTGSFTSDAEPSSSPRAYKTLTVATTVIEANACAPSNTGKSTPAEAHVEKTTVQAPPPARIRSAAPTKRPPSPATAKIEVRSIPPTDIAALTAARSSSEVGSTMPHLEDALIHITSLGVPLWDASEDDGGILSGLKGKLIHNFDSRLTLKNLVC